MQVLGLLKPINLEAEVIVMAEKFSGLKRWFKEKWTKPDGEECGTSDDKNNPEKCRPSVKVTSKTPVTWSKLDEKEKKNIIKNKQEANKNNVQRASKTLSNKSKK